jgi:hypothetical protein
MKPTDYKPSTPSVVRDKSPVTARHKLNVAFITGIFIVSGLAGMATESYSVFMIALIVMLIGGYHDGSLRI